MKCPRQYEFRYVKGLVIPPKGIMVQGTAYHGALKENFQYKIKKKEDLDIKDLVDAYDTSWNKAVKGEIKDKGEEEEIGDQIEWGDDKPDALKDEGFRMVQFYHKAYAPVIIPVEVEKEASRNITPDILLHGYLDLVTAEKIIDHKLKGRKMSDDDVKQDTQAFAYCFLKNMPDFEFHCAVKTKTPVVYVLPAKKTADEINWWLEQVKLISRQMDTGIAPPNSKGWHCSEKFCGYWDRCREMKEDIFIFGDVRPKKKRKKRDLGIE